MPDRLDTAVRRVAAAGGLDPAAAEDEVVAELGRVADALAVTTAPLPDAKALAAIDTPATIDGALIEPWLTGELLWRRMRDTAVALPQAAQRLALSAAAVRRVVSVGPGEGELFGVKDARGAWRIFSYQLPDEFGRGGEPGSNTGRRVQRNLPPSMHPVAIAAWWDAPNAALHLDGADLSPRAWLARGHDPDRLVDVARCEDAD